VRDLVWFDGENGRKGYGRGCVAVHFLEKRGLMWQCAADCIYEELKTAVVLNEKAKKTNEVFGYETNSIHG
jgi:hypothetical protein